MRRAQYAGEEKIQVVESPELTPGPGEVVVETAVSALCGSELHAYRGAAQEGNGGHEAAGTIAALGEGVMGLEIGQRVGVSCIAGCGQCAYCAKGQYTYCRDHKFLRQHARRTLPAAACLPSPAG